MKRNSLLILGVIAVVGFAVFMTLLRSPAEPSAPLEAIPLQTQAASPSEPAAQADPTATPTQPPTDSASTPEAAGDSADGGETGSGDAAASPGDPAGMTAGTGTTIFVIDQSRSEARFAIDETLRGDPFTAIGSTNQVAGEIAVDFDNPGASALGVVIVNARTLRTDSSMRDNMIASQILNSNQFEFITFTPRALTGLPGQVNVGDTINFLIEGDLTIRDVTVPAIFDAEITITSADRLEGYASAVVSREAFGITIPQVASVAWVDDAFLLEIIFVATPK